MSDSDPTKQAGNTDGSGMAETSGERFEQLGKQKQSGLIGEIIHFFVEYRNWWLIPIFIVLLCVSLLLVLASTGAAPFIYTLF